MFYLIRLFFWLGIINYIGLYIYINSTSSNILRCWKIFIVILFLVVKNLNDIFYYMYKNIIMCYVNSISFIF